MQEPFKGSKTYWKSSDGRIFHVDTLTKPHLINILESIRRIAKNEIEKGKITFHPFDEIQISEIDDWLEENCITYPKLKDRAKKMKCFDAEMVMGPYQVSLPNSSIPLYKLEELIYKLEDRIKNLENRYNG